MPIGNSQYSITPILQYSITNARVYLLLGFLLGYILLIWFNPIRQSLRDGLRCLLRFKRIGQIFVLLGFSYFVFQFATFTPIQNMSDVDPGQIASFAEWHWPRFTEIWGEVPLPVLEGVAGIFDNPTTTYPLSAIAALLLFSNWRGLLGVLHSALRKRYKLWSYLIYLILLLGALASVLKPLVFWQSALWGGELAPPKIVQISAIIDAVAFIFEYLFGVYIQVYLITVSLAWIKGLGFEEGELLRFAMRRFTYVLEWAGIVIIISSLFLRLPLLLAHFTNIPDVLDYLPIQRAFMSGLIIAFCSVQISLVLHNESLGAAIRAHWGFINRNLTRLGWFLLICTIHFFMLAGSDAIMRGAIGDRLVALFLWKTVLVIARGFIIGWLLASWVCLFRQCARARIGQETWITY
jgi:hypothetical protein